MFDLTYEELKKLWAYLMAEGDSEMKPILEKLTKALKEGVNEKCN